MLRGACPFPVNATEAFATPVPLLSLTMPVTLPLRSRTNAEGLASDPSATATDAAPAAPTVNPAGGVTASVYVPGGTSAKV